VESFGEIWLPIRFYHWFSVPPRHAGSKILINGFFTEKNMISHSARQGFPMNMALFVLFIEPMIRAINHKTSGVIVNSQLMKVFAYTDDVNYIVTSD
jgi:hypothetical protein